MTKVYLNKFTNKNDAYRYFMKKYSKLYHKKITDFIMKLDVNREEKDDLKQVASIALLKALDRYDDKMPNKFASYAIPCMLYEITDYLRCNRHNLIRTPRAFRETLDKISKYENMFGDTDDTLKIARFAGVPEVRVQRALENVSMKNQYWNNKADISECEWVQYKHPVRTIQDIDARLDRSNLINIAKRIVKNSTPQNYDAFCMVYGLNEGEPMHIREVADIFGISSQSLWSRLNYCTRRIKKYFDKHGITYIGGH